MRESIKKLVRPITPKIAKKIYNFFRIDLDNYYLLPKKDVTYATDQLYTFHNADFRNDPRFIEAYALARAIDGGQLLGKNDIPWRMHVLYWAGNHAKTLEGDFIDCGVNTGFCARSLMHYIGFEKTSKTYYLLDTFAGLDPRYSSEKELRANKLLNYETQKDNFEKAKETFKGFKVRIIRGSVPDTLPQADAEKICFLHLDMNAAVPEVAALDYFWGKISKGGIVLFDDYAYEGCGPQKVAHDTWAKVHGVEILSLPTGQGLLIKP